MSLTTAQMEQITLYGIKNKITAFRVKPSPVILNRTGENSSVPFTLLEGLFEAGYVRGVTPRIDGYLKWSIVGGEDADLFSIDEDTGVPVFLVQPVFSAPADADGDNVYWIEVACTHHPSNVRDTSFVRIEVEDATPTVYPSIPGEQRFSVPELSPAGTVIGTVATLIDTGSAQDFAIVGGTGQGLVDVNTATGQLTVADTGGTGETNLGSVPGTEIDVRTSPEGPTNATWTDVSGTHGQSATGTNWWKLAADGTEGFIYVAETSAANVGLDEPFRVCVEVKPVDAGVEAAINDSSGPFPVASLVGDGSITSGTGSIRKDGESGQYTLSFDHLADTGDLNIYLHLGKNGDNSPSGANALSAGEGMLFGAVWIEPIGATSEPTAVVTTGTFALQGTVLDTLDSPTKFRVNYAASSGTDITGAPWKKLSDSNTENNYHYINDEIIGLPAGAYWLRFIVRPDEKDYFSLNWSGGPNPVFHLAGGGTVTADAGYIRRLSDDAYLCALAIDHAATGDLEIYWHNCGPAGELQYPGVVGEGVEIGRVDYEPRTGATADMPSAVEGNTASLIEYEQTPELVLDLTFSDGTTTSAVGQVRIDVLDIYTPPVNLTAPSIAGTGEVGQTLTPTAGTYDPTPTGYERYWRRVASPQATTGTSVSSVVTTLPSYVIQAGDAGEHLQMLERAQDNGSWSDWVVSNSIGPIDTPDTIPVLINSSTGSIVLSESAQVGTAVPNLNLSVQDIGGRTVVSREIVSDTDNKFSATLTGAQLSAALDYSADSSHPATVRWTLSDDTVLDFPFTLSVVQAQTGGSITPDYWVATTGSDSNSGTSSGSPFRTVNKALTLAQPGDIVAVKAGNYGNMPISTKRAGTASNPIRVIGYTNTPGDAPEYPVLWDYNNDTPNASLMPVTDPGGRDSSSAFGILMQHAHNHIEGITVRNFRWGLYVTAADCSAERVYTAEHGRTDTVYDGMGVFIQRTAPRFTGRKLYVVNANAQAFSFRSDHCYMEDFGSSCNYAYPSGGEAHGGPTDYYCTISGSYNTFKNFYGRRLSTLGHNGHGIQCKHQPAEGICTGNVIDGFETHDILSGCGSRHAEVDGNVWRNGVIYGGYGIWSRDGGKNNLYEDITINNASAGITIAESNEAESGNPLNYSASGEVYRRITMNNVGLVVNFNNWNDVTAEANDLEFDQITVNGANYLFRVGHFVKSNCVFKNSDLNNVTRYAIYAGGRSAGDNDIVLTNNTGVP